MKTKTLIIALILSIGIFTACTDKKKTKEKTEVETEIISEESKTTAEETIDEDEKRRLDSIRQVKEHGHAH
ncbi:hypothetical protein [uncultured Winogradskyella sp.]|uniref:hypothetical protein n=1 Tax=uncultured Winogradskyella sp. TaxID=395353 RepID=UPI00260337BE|nr:hypothetical protein [uncultured Winogradskyella sp.]